MGAAYADILSLLNTAKRLHDSSRVSTALEETVRLFALKEVASLGEVVSKLDGYLGGSRMNGLDGRASEAVRKLEDILECHILDPIIILHSQSFSRPVDDHANGLFSRDDLEQVKRDIRTIRGVMENYYQELTMKTMAPGSRNWWSCCWCSRLPEEAEEDDDDGAGASEIGHINRPKMVGFSREFETIWLISIKGLSRPGDGYFVALDGMAGVGKTTLAKEIFEHPTTAMLYDCRVWVTVGQKCKWKQLIRRILAQVDPENYRKTMKAVVGEKELEGQLKESFKDRGYFIVLDDVWDEEMVGGLREHLSDRKDQGIVLLTTRLNKVASICDFPCKIEPMDKEDSWDILRERMFGEEPCPHQLVEAGRKVAEECEGLPLLTVAVANLLSKADKTPEYWNEVAEKRNSVFMDAHDQIMDVLRPSYTHLDVGLRPAFIYMGVFPRKYRIQRSEIMTLWYAEGIDLTGDVSLEAFATHCFVCFYEENIIIKRQKYEIKNCSLHSVFWHLCMREAEKNKFFHVLKKRADSLAEGIKGQRRLCIQNNVLFSIKDVYNAMASISTVRSLLCTGPYHQYPVPLSFNPRLLRVLYALTIRFYEFPTEVVKLLLLRYLALTFDGKIPSFISKLWNLESLIVHRHFRIKSSTDPSYLPTEIWDMKELKYLQIMGTDLPDPCGALLPNLLTLSDVGVESCTKSVFEGLPKLKTLGVRIELTPDVAGHSSCFDHISHLHTIESLKCVIGSPNLKSPQAPMKTFQQGLKRLSLSGFGYPWEDMRVIASLPNLEILKLRSYAFRGPIWEVSDERLIGFESDPTKDTEEYVSTFERLKFLSIKDTDLVHWRITRASFPSLKYLTMKHCYKLEGIPMEFEYSRTVQVIELVDCSPSAVVCAEQLEDIKNDLRVYVHSSYRSENIK